eukprot:TRINITY_DN9861_c0_g1_i1.p1 TRINITY_DN9861_c0_g1~~TRINITY_DN9861_c0_g1_i1.p1  ORF type:complete len:238 (-),score=23.10 TRINITY_DN9861_c0_g1_i1:18-731(-)
MSLTATIFEQELEALRHRLPHSLSAISGGSCCYRESLDEATERRNLYVTLREVPLSLTGTAHRQHSKDTDVDPHLLLFEETLELDEDPASASPSITAHDHLPSPDSIVPLVGEDEEEVVVLTCTYDIIYSRTFSVPVLYFLLMVDGVPEYDLQKTYSYLFRDLPDVSSPSWETYRTIVTQAEHPFLAHTLFTVHPCHTADLMRPFGVEEEPGRYLARWLSVVASLTGLRLDWELLLV